MRNYICILLAVLSLGFKYSSAQSKDSSYILSSCFPVLPEYPGGNDSLAAFVKENLHYPNTAIKDSVQGEVIIFFTVDTVGTIGDIKIKKSVRYDLDNEAIRVISIMPKWYPGSLPHKTSFNLPINFTLPNKSISPPHSRKH